MSTFLRTIAAGGVIALGIAAAPAAAAHVSASASTTTAGSYTLVTLGVPHGCGESATNEVRISIPEGINAVTPTVNPGWDLEKVTETLAEPTVDSHGNEVTERVSEVVYTAHEPLPADLRDAFELSLRLPEDTAGQTLYFPTVQNCEEGEAAWIQIPTEGQDTAELDMPSPKITVAAAETEAAVDGWAIAGLVTGVVALLVGLAALLRGGRR